MSTDATSRNDNENIKVVDSLCLLETTINIKKAVKKYATVQHLVGQP